MIQSFEHRGLEQFFLNSTTRGFDPAMAMQLRARLAVLHAATSIQDLNLPGYNLHQLRGDRAGTWSIRVTGNWRLTFRIEDENVYDVNQEDYH